MTQLETDLRAWMHDRAARIHPSPELLEADYRPRAHPLRPRLAIGGGIAALAATIGAVLSLAGGAGSAFAGWTAKPTTPSPAQLAATEAYCARTMGFPNLPLKLVDARGPFTFVIHSDGSSNDFCTTGPSFANSSGWRSSPPVTPPADGLFLWTDHTSTDGAQSYGTLIASAGSDVTGANLTLDDGSVVTATVENGWVVAWWPGTHHVASAQLATASGTRTQSFPAYPCDVHSCTGGPHGAAPGGGPGGG